MKAQAGFGSVFKAESVARDICRGIERGKFLITHGFDGFLLGVIATGMSPVYHWATLITEVSSLSSLPAVIILFWLAKLQRHVCKFLGSEAFISLLE